MFGGCSVWPVSEAWFSVWDSPLSWHLCGSVLPRVAPGCGEMQIPAHCRPWLAARNPSSCLSLWILLTPLELHFQVPSGLVNVLATETLHFTAPISVTPSECTLVLSVDAQGHKSCGREHHTGWGGLSASPVPSTFSLLSLAQASCPQPVVAETCSALGFWFMDFRNYRGNLNSHM